jgi:hypothetical protein
MADHPADRDDRSRPQDPPVDTTERKLPMNINPRVAFLVALPAGLAVFATGCFYDEEGNGDIETVAFEDFDEIDVNGVAVEDDLDVRIHVDPNLPQTATVTIDDNLLDRGAATLDDDGTLAIGFDGLGDIDPSRTPLVTLTLRELDTIENHADGDVIVSGIDGGSLYLSNTDDGTISAAGRADAVDIDGDNTENIDLSRLIVI